MKKLTFLMTCCIMHAGTYAQDWHIAGNSGTNASTNFIGTTDNVAFKIRTNNAVRMTINSSGKVGVGTTTPQDKFHVSGTGPLARFGTGTTSSTFNYWYTGNDVGSYIEQRGNTTIKGSDKFRLQSSKSGNAADYAQFIIDPNKGFSFLTLGTGNGNVGIGTNSLAYKFSVTAAPALETPVAYIENTSGTNLSDGLYIKAGSNTSGGAYFINFLRPDGTQIGTIIQNSGANVSYLTTSDKRLKNIIGASQKGLSDLMKINIYDYTFKSDPDKKVRSGFMAQELYEIFPQSVSKPRENNEPAEKNPWMVDYASITPLIIKSVQEQQQMIGELKKSNEDLKKQIDELKAMMVSSQSTVNSQSSTVSFASLEQNIPNPFSNTTTINYSLPNQFTSAKIVVTDKSGKALKEVTLSAKGKGSLKLDVSTLSSGVYQYSMYMDGRMIDTKQMIIAR